MSPQALYARFYQDEIAKMESEEVPFMDQALYHIAHSKALDKLVAEILPEGYQPMPEEPPSELLKKLAGVCYFYDDNEEIAMHRAYLDMLQLAKEMREKKIKGTKSCFTEPAV